MSSAVIYYRNGIEIQPRISLDPISDLFDNLFQKLSFSNIFRNTRTLITKNL